MGWCNDYCIVDVSVSFEELTGRVQIERDSVRGYICDSDWTENDALVLCRQLGYVYGHPMYVPTIHIPILVSE